jgi:hypothetical protein
MILRMESSLMRTLKTKERLCCDTIDNDAMSQLQRKTTGKKRAILVAAVEVSREAQEGILGMQPARMYPGWSTSKTPTAVVGRCRLRKERRCPKI